MSLYLKQVQGVEHIKGFYISVFKKSDDGEDYLPFTSLLIIGDDLRETLNEINEMFNDNFKIVTLERKIYEISNEARLLEDPGTESAKINI